MTRSRPGAAIARGVLALALLGPTAAEARAFPAGPSCETPAEELPRLSPIALQAGRLAPGEATCFGIVLQRGEFVRVSIEADAGYLRTRVLEPRRHDVLQVTLTWSFFPSLPLAFEAPTTGVYVVELSVPAEVPLEEAPSFRIQIDEWVSADARAARREDLRRDPRTAWLRERSAVIRSIDPEDEDFSDLEFLREVVVGARVVLIGEGDHGGGSDLHAKTRLVKFLHREMGFDVLALEAGLLSTAVARQALQTDTDPREAFLMGVFGLWGRSEQAQSLIRYVGSSVRSERPLEIAGFDSQFTGTARAAWPSALRDLLRLHEVESPLADESGSASRILDGVLDGRFAHERETLPDLEDQARLVESLRATAGHVERRVPGREGAFWGQALRSAATQVGLMLDDLRRPDDSAAYSDARDRQMGENLVWLVNEYHRGRKIIVTAHTSHVMRNPRARSSTPGLAKESSMGHGLWQALGDETFAIGLTSYRGTTHWLTLPDGVDQDIVPDQHPSFEFEELMDAAGHELAFVNLRQARAEGGWLGGSFPSSALYLMPERSVWSELLDALLFIRNQEPRRSVAE